MKRGLSASGRLSRSKKGNFHTIELIIEALQGYERNPEGLFRFHVASPISLLPCGIEPHVIHGNPPALPTRLFSVRSQSLNPKLATRNIHLTQASCALHPRPCLYSLLPIE
jgi:hypothetical protein